ncbi:MAG: PhoPQ-activated pathogenicity-like protein PqaA type, partial [Tannerella sp.]|nr:PhoPQ-activated pathogenicity-like protein PqaA type [Tannerella sp.]
MNKQIRLLLLFLCLSLLSAVYGKDKIIVTPATALDAYLNNDDPTWAWEVRENYPSGKTQAWSLLLISQKWEGILWKHELIVFV